MLFKRCPDCNIEKAISDFGKNLALSDGLQFYCKACCSRRGAATYRRQRARMGRTVREKREVPEGHKYCPACKSIKPHDDWHRSRRTRDGLASQCKSCRKVSSRRDHLKRTFGITEEERAAILKRQGGVCAICGTPDPEHLDHDHATGKIRGILCNRCNMGLGLFSDDPVRLQSAINYLRGLRVEVFDPPPFPIEYTFRHAA
jgi:hypothetical protein